MTLPYAISPYLQEKMLYLGQKEVFAQASDTFTTMLQLEVSASQIRRLCLHYGELEEMTTILETAHPSESNDKDSTLYIEADGSNIYTDDGWKEVKLGRIFREADIKEQKTEKEGVSPRRTIEKSDYLSYKGSYDEFIIYFENLINNRIEQGHKQVVFITDGETWMENWLAEKYEEHPRILDYYHAVKPLRRLAEKVFTSPIETEKWIEKQKDRLLDSKVEEILQEVEALQNLNENGTQAQKALQTYYKNNQHRMDYKSYLEKGWCIGSGAIESAHITVIQKRMKLCGQRWGIETAQPLLNIRAIHQSKKWNKMRELVVVHSFKKNKKAA